jgi:hypothetical protein
MQSIAEITEARQVLSNKEIEFVHNELVKSFVDAGRSDLRAAFILGFARAIEYAVLERVAPEMVGKVN